MAIDLLSNNTIEDKTPSKEDIIDILGEDDEKEEGKKPEKDEKDSKEEKEDEDEEIEVKEDDEEGDEVPELKAGLKEVTKAHPDLFKKFPFLKNSYYRERQFAEVFSDPQDAIDAAERLEGYAELERSVASGNVIDFFKAVKEDNPRAFTKIADQYLETLAKVDEKAYEHVLSGVYKTLIASIAREGRKLDNEELKKVALALNRYIFDSDSFTPHQPLSSRGKEEDDEVNKEKEDWLRERFESTRDELDESVINTMQSTIEKHIDPKSQMTDYVRRTAVKDALDQTMELVSKDSSLKRQMEQLWKKAAESRFSSASRKAIKNAYLAKVQVVLPTALKKARNEALRGLEKRVKRERTTFEEDTSETKESTPSKNRGKKEVPKGMTSLEFLNQD